MTVRLLWPSNKYDIEGQLFATVAGNYKSVRLFFCRQGPAPLLHLEPYRYYRNSYARTALECTELHTSYRALPKCIHCIHIQGVRPATLRPSHLYTFIVLRVRSYYYIASVYKVRPRRSISNRSLYTCSFYRSTICGSRL